MQITFPPPPPPLPVWLFVFSRTTTTDGDEISPNEQLPTTTKGDLINPLPSISYSSLLVSLAIPRIDPLYSFSLVQLAHSLSHRLHLHENHTKYLHFDNHTTTSNDTTTVSSLINDITPRT